MRAKGTATLSSSIQQVLGHRPPRVFEGLTYTFADDRFSYGEQRYVTLGLLSGIPVSVVHTETEHEIRVISFRKATSREAVIYFSQVQN